VSATGASPTAEALLEHERARVNAALARVAHAAVEGTVAGLREPMAYALATPGKRLRPVLCAAAWRAVRGGEAPEAVYELAAAVEVVHTYSLVHDDLPCMDDDALRRGRPTVHTVYGNLAAVLAGVALIPVAVQALDGAARALGLDAAVRAALVGELCSAGGATGMVGGQLLDLEAEGIPLAAEALERIHRSKTGALLAASLRIGALAAGAGEQALAALSVYGQELGLAFQIVDDVLDITGDAGSLGKTAGKDHSAGKTTYPSLYGIEVSERRAAECVARAVNALHASDLPSAELEALARYIVDRRH
jgi:geranylgeranyl pyrophosphate synthase